MTKRVRHLTASLVLGACLAVSLWTARAVPPIPNTLYGQLSLAGVPAADGTLIQAMIAGTVFVSNRVFTYSGLPGLYKLEVPGDDLDTQEKEGGLPQETISFAVDGYEIGQTATWVQGAVQGLDLENAPFVYKSATREITGSVDITFVAHDGGPSLIVNAGGLDLGLTTVNIAANQECTPQFESEIRRCFDIDPTLDTGRNATLTFFFYESQVPAGSTCETVEIFHWDGSGWASLSRDPTYGFEGRDCGSERHSIRVRNVADFSSFVLSAEPPNAVEVTAFAASAQGRAVALTWEATIQVDVLGFHLFRADLPEGTPTRLNREMIPAQSPGSPVGVLYAWRDESIQPARTYWYWLDEIAVKGSITRHGPVSATANEYWIHMPLLHK